MNEFFSNLHFLRPGWLTGVLPVAAIVWINLVSRNPVNALRGVIAPHLLTHLVVEPRVRRRVKPGQILALLAFLSIVALAGPTWRKEPSPFAEERAALMVVMKITPSMQASDLQPSRLERARNKLHDLLALRAGARTGLIAYAGSAHLVVPPTTDARIVEQLAAALEPSIMPVEGDALADALSLAQAQLDAFTGAGSVIVITDAIPGNQLAGLAEHETGVPVQLLATVASEETAAQNGILEGARSLSAPLQLVTPDDTDVRKLNTRAVSAAAATTGEGERWRDEGYLLVPLIAFGTLLWGIRGWSVGWE